ncbi:MAG TPA: cytidylate kinase family protein [Syntrophorhabdales bacterium]|nr:cytidylate kinase family protein [Syntrophorhabdales bacterium]
MYFITLSRRMGANGSEIARQVVQELRYHLYDTEAIENAAREMGFLKDVKDIDGKAPSLFERIFSSRPQMHLDRMMAVLCELASRGNALFLGRGSHILLREFPCAMHVRVTASLDKRIENLKGRGFGREAATRAIRKSDHERAAFIKFAFGVDWDNPELYDLVLNMDHLTVPLAADIVTHMATSEEVKTRSMDAMQSLAMMGLARKAEAALIEKGFSPPYVSVCAIEPCKLRLTGTVGVPWEKANAETIVKGIQGITSIDNQIQIAAAFSKGA